MFQVKDPEGDNFDVTNQYDGLNRLIKVTYAETPEDEVLPTEQYFYDGVGNLINFKDKAGVETRTTYDSLGRVATKTLIESISNSITNSRSALGTMMMQQFKQSKPMPTAIQPRHFMTHLEESNRSKMRKETP